MNIVLITLDDVSFYTLGFTKFFEIDVTPNIDYMAGESYVFWNSHCNIPFCQPSRSVLMTGIYPQNNGSVVFNPINNVPTLSNTLRGEGYFTSIIGKLSHYKPDSVYNWHEKKSAKLSQDVVKLSKNFLKKSPCFLNVNIAYPHRPFIKSNFDLKVSNSFFGNTNSNEIGDYMQSLSLADSIVGEILSMTNNDDIVVLTSDHGMSFPYIKGNCYGLSTNVPMILKNKNVLKKHDKENLISHVDFMPTIVDWLGLQGKFDGKSYFKTITNGEIFNNKFVYTQLNQMLTGPLCRIRSLTSVDHSYVVNIDQKYPGECVDGWGWDESIKNIGSDFFNRPIEEFYTYSRLNMYESKDLILKSKMRKNLLKYMKEFDDPEYFNMILELRKTITHL